MNTPDLRTVCNAVVRTCWRGLHAAGVSEAEFHANTGIRLDELNAPKGRINAVKHARLTQYVQRFAATRHVVDICPAAWFADQATVSSVCLNSGTLREAILHFFEYRPLVGEFDMMLLREGAGTLEVEYASEFLPGRGASPAFANFKSLAIVVRAYDAGAGAGAGAGAATPFEVGLQGPTPQYAGAMSEFFGAPVSFGQARNTMRFRSDRLDRPFEQFNAVLAPHLLARARDELRELRQAHRFSARVEQAIRDLLPAAAQADSASLLRRLCDALRVAPWSLRRMLQQEATSFRELEMKVKSEEAVRLLQSGALSMGEISDRLGFSSQSAFTRFFKMQHQVPPVRYRQEAATGAVLVDDALMR